MPETILADVLSFLSSKTKGAGSNEIGRMLAKLGYEPLYTRKDRLHPVKLTKILKAAEQKGLIESDYPIGEAYKTERGKPNLCRITKRGVKFLTKHKIRSMWGFVGLKWAEELWEKGYEIQFLNKLTDIETHENFLFAWHRTKRDIRMLQFLKPREYSKGKLIGFRFTKDLTKPVGQRIEESNPIEDFVLNEVGKEFTEEKIRKALQKFFDYPRQHNMFIAQLLPTDPIHFGMPMGLNFELISFLALGFEEIPLIPNMLQHEHVALELPISESIIGKLKLTFDVGKVNRWLIDVIKDSGLRPEFGAFGYVGPILVCKHNTGEGNKNGKCKLGLTSKCGFIRTQHEYIEPPCDQVRKELEKLLPWRLSTSF